MRLNLITLFILVLTACTPQKYKNFSGDDKYKYSIGKFITTLVQTESLGVTFGSLRDKKVDYVFVTPKPNFSGPEVIFRKDVPTNTRFEIIGVYGSNSFLFENSYYFHVKEIGIETRKDLIHLIEFECNSLQENGGLDAKIFRLEIDKKLSDD